MASSEASGIRILVVEDEWLIAHNLCGMLSDFNFDVVGPVSSIPEALDQIAKYEPDAALLDISLRGVKSYAIAQELMARGTPFMFLTGYQEADLPAEFKDCQIIRKPITPAVLHAPLMSLAARCESAA